MAMRVGFRRIIEGKTGEESSGRGEAVLAQWCGSAGRALVSCLSAELRRSCQIGLNTEATNYGKVVAARPTNATQQKVTLAPHTPPFTHRLQHGNRHARHRHHQVVPGMYNNFVAGRKKLYHLYWSPPHPPLPRHTLSTER